MSPVSHLAWHNVDCQSPGAADCILAGQLFDKNKSPPLISVIIPSYKLHFPKLCSQLISWEHFAADVHRFRFSIIVTSASERTALLKLTKARVSARLLLSVRDVDQVVASAGETASMGPLCGRNAFKHVCQSVKKVYGCLASRSRWCFASDSETLLFRCFSLEQALASYLSAGPAIFYNSAFKPRPRPYYGGFGCVPYADKLLLGIDPGMGWMLESYSWFWEADLLASFLSYLQTRGTTPVQLWNSGAFGNASTPDKCSTRLFIEQTFNKYIALRQRGKLPQTSSSGQGANSPPRPYLFVDTMPLVRSMRPKMPTKIKMAIKDWPCSIFECLAAYLPQANAEQVVLLARTFSRHAIPTLTPRSNFRSRNDTEWKQNASYRKWWFAPEMRPLLPPEAAFINLSGVSIMSSGDGGPLHQYARHANNWSPGDQDGRRRSCTERMPMLDRKT